MKQRILQTKAEEHSWIKKWKKTCLSFYDGSRELKENAMELAFMEICTVSIIT